MRVFVVTRDGGRLELDVEPGYTVLETMELLKARHGWEIHTFRLVKQETGMSMDIDNKTLSDYHILQDAVLLVVYRPIYIG